MEYKKKIQKVLIASISFFAVGIGLGFLFEAYDNFWFYWENTEAVVEIIGLFSLVTFLSSAILYFLREEVFLSWFKFAKYYLPIALFLILGFSSDGGGSFSMGNDMEGMVFFSASIYFLISLILIIYKSIKLRGK
jgi:hypothetical protein